MAHSITLAWQASPDSTAAGFQGYNVKRGVASGQESTLLTTTPIQALTFTDAEAQLGANFYIVTAVVNGTESPASNEANMVILPAAPTGLTITAHS